MAPAVILSTVYLLMLCYAGLASGRDMLAEDLVPLQTSTTGVPRAVCKEIAPFIIGAYTNTEVSLSWYYFDGRTVKNTKPCSTLNRTSSTQKCRIFFRVDFVICSDGRSNPLGPLETYGPFADWGSMVQSFGKAGQHNFTTFPGANIQLTVMAYYAYYEGAALNIGKEEYVPLLEDERIGTFEFAHRATYQKKRISNTELPEAVIFQDRGIPLVDFCPGIE